MALTRRRAGGRGGPAVWCAARTPAKTVRAISTSTRAALQPKLLAEAATTIGGSPAAPICGVAVMPEPGSLPPSIIGSTASALGTISAASKATPATTASRAEI